MGVVVDVQRRLSRVEVLRELDSILDFSRSTVQLELILYMGLRPSGIKPREAAKELRINTKSVYDALSKLVSKGLVERASPGSYVLTEAGKEFVRKLEDLFTPSGEDELVTSPGKVSIGTAAVSKNVLFYNYVYESMLAIGASPSKELSIKDLSRMLGVSESTLLDYLEVVSAGKGKTGLLKKVVKSLGEGRKEIYFRLTDYGHQELSRFMEYRRIKSSKALTYLMKVTRSLTVYDGLRRASLLSLVFITASLASFAFIAPLVGFLFGVLGAASVTMVFLSIAR
ncbi:MAG: hypothetical protein J7L55_00420 [Desulfurococcales archaeon]|nr:hypothetical protein [Desulfurococcales archaeon]